MTKQEIIPLTEKVQIKIGLITQLNQKANEGVILPRHDNRIRLDNMAVLFIANLPVGVSLEAYQRSQGRKRGRILYARMREEASFIRKEFSEFLEVRPPRYPDTDDGLIR